jgi:peptidoglycan/xylan/chitin deacetylase (PgdA/CDA1 family)/PKD repeat protein
MFVGDYAQNWIKRLVLDSSYNVVDVVMFDDSPNGPVEITTGPDGHIYYLSIYTGELMRITHTDGNRRPIAEASATPESGLLPLEVAFSSVGSNDPDGDAFTYEWNFGDGVTSTEPNPIHTYTSAGTYNAVLTLTDIHGSTGTKSISITAGNQAPVASITSPASGTLYVVGQTLTIDGTGADFEDGVLSASQFDWSIIIHHNTHIHIFQEFTGVSSIAIDAPDHSASDVYLEVELTVTDSTGLTDTTSINMYLNNGGGAGNLIANPSLEIADETSGQPLSWHTGWYGEMNPIFTYPVPGLDGTSAAKVEITSYVDGDAKWYFDPVFVTPGENYTFQNTYTATVPTVLTVQYSLSNGTYMYDALASLPATATPVHNQYTLTVPSGAQTVAVFHELEQVGELVVDNYSLALSTETDTEAPVASVTSPVEGATVAGTVSVTIDAADNVGVEEVHLLINDIEVATDATAPYTFALDTLTLANGVHTISAHVHDTAGNEGVASPVSVSVSNAINLVLNGNLETEDGDEPLGWNKSSWGDHVATFSYPVVGHNGEKAARVDITSYAQSGTGDTKWYFEKIPVTPGVEYSYTDHYRSDTISDIIGQYTLDDGSFHYFGLHKEIPPSATWSTSGGNFTPPANATHVTFFHLISAVGFLEIDDANLFEVGTGTPSETNAPIVEFTNPLEGQTVSGTIGVTASSTDDTAVTYIFYAVNGIPVTGQITDAPYLFNWDTTTVADGVHTLKATTHDPFGNNSTHTITVTVDNSIVVPPPTGNLILNPSLEVSGGNGNPANWFRGSWGDNVHTFQYPVAGIHGATAAKVEIVSYSSGDVKWFFADVAVTAGTTYQYSEQYRTNVPTELLARYTMTNGSTQYAFIEALPAAPAWTTFATDITPPAGVATITVFHILHSTGNLEVDDFSLTGPAGETDTEAPVVSITSPTEAATTSGVVSVTADATDNVGIVGVELLIDGVVVLSEDTTAPFTFAWDSTTVTNGPHTLEARARDAAGNVATSTAVTVTVDNSVTPPPTGNLIADPYMDSIETNPTQTDWLNGGWGTNDRVFSLAKAGPVDNGGKVEITTYTNGDAKWFFKDVVVTPNTTYTFSNYYQSNVSTELIARMTLADGSFQYVFLQTVPATSADGSYTLAEVTTPVNAVSMTIFHTLHSAGWLFVDTYKLYEGSHLPDVTVPGVTITSHDLEMAGDTERIRVLLHIDENIAISQSGIFVDGPITYQQTESANAEQPFSLYYDENRSWFIYPDQIPDGEYQVTAWARDAAGNTGSSTPVTITIDGDLPPSDTIPPLVSITSHTNSDVVSGVVTLTADASDNVVVAEVSFFVDGLMITDTTSPYSIEWNTATIPNGTYAIVAVAKDTSNNLSTPEQISVTVANQESNLIQNPSLETIGGNGDPEHWFKGGWGTNDRVFTYPTTGYVGANAARVEMTNYVDGDAKWRFEDVAVAGGETYTMTHAYRSDVVTNVTARYTLPDGSFQYVSLGNRGASLEWQEISHTFVVPAGAVSMTVMHILYSNGFLEVDEFTLVNGNTNVFAQGMVSFTFDDGWLSHYTQALPILDAANIDGTFYIVSQETLLGAPEEMIQNADLETAGVGDNPEYWLRGGWGTNTAVHTYPEVDATGGNAVKVEITDYTDGDAKWFFQDAPVTAGEDYIVKLDYKSNIPSVLIARYTKTDGSFIYAGIQNLGSTGDAWVSLVDSILVPADVTSVTLFHTISEVGYLTTDNYSIKRIQDYLDPTQMLAIQASGHELGGHSRTHASMTAIPLSEAQVEIGESRNEILAMGGIPVNAFAYPFGDYNVDVQALVEGAGYTSGRSVDRGFNTMATDKLALKIQSVNRETTMAEIEAWTAQAIADKTWLIFMFHQIDHDLNQTLGVTPEFLTDIVNYVNTTSIDVVTVGEGVQLMSN